MAPNLTGIACIKNYYLKGVLSIYIVAFTSLYLQVQSLFGDNGIVPLRDFMSRAATGARPSGSLMPFELNSIIALAPKVGLGYGEFVELLCFLGVFVALAGLLIRNLTNAFTFGFLWYIYYSICLVGQGFMSFHSDLLLLEVGFITILLAPLLPTSKIGQSDHDHITFFLVKWLAFRYFVTNALNVYLDNDEAWYKMTAIPMVAQSVQFPSLFSWHVYNFNPETVKLYQAYEHAVKICAPFLMLLDLKYSRLLGFYTLLFVALPSALFFNFGWTDLLIAICLISFLKDAYFYDDKRAKQSSLRSFVDILCVFTYIAAVVAILVKFFGVRYESNVLKTQVTFTPAQFKLFADHIVPVSLVFGIIGILFAAYTTYFNSSRKSSVIKTFIYTVVAVLLFFSTFPTLTRFAPNLENKIKPVAYTKDFSRFVAPYMISNNYILLSKVSAHYSDGRPELQVQSRASADDTTWQQYDLRYKPGLPSRELTRVVPHLPRIDLKMWYAARSTLQSNQWLNTFAYRVATKEPDVVNALTRDTILPKVSHVRVALMSYKYSSKGRQPFAGYWSQSKFKTEYMPAASVENLKFTVKSNGISLAPSAKIASDPKSTSFEKLLSTYLESASSYVRALDHTIVIWSLGAIATVSMFG